MIFISVMTPRYIILHIQCYGWETSPTIHSHMVMRLWVVNISKTFSFLLFFHLGLLGKRYYPKTYLAWSGTFILPKLNCSPYI